MEIDLLIKNAREKLRQAQDSHNEADHDYCYMHIRETHRMLTQYLESVETENKGTLLLNRLSSCP